MKVHKITILVTLFVSVLLTFALAMGQQASTSTAQTKPSESCCAMDSCCCNSGSCEMPANAAGMAKHAKHDKKNHAACCVMKQDGASGEMKHDGSCCNMKQDGAAAAATGDMKHEDCCCDMKHDGASGNMKHEGSCCNMKDKNKQKEAKKQ
jgi:hypothetical protein